MNKYYRLDFTIEDTYAYVTYVNLADEEWYKLLTGKKIVIPSLKADIKNKSGFFPDIMGISISQPLVSDKFKHLLLQTIPEEQLQFIPVAVVDKTYWLLNILNNIDCFDWEKSEYKTSSSGGLRKVTKGVLKTNLLEGINLFRVFGKSVDIFISETLIENLEKNNIKGFRIIKTDNWEKSWDEKE